MNGMCVDRPKVVRQADSSSSQTLLNNTSKNISHSRTAGVSTNGLEPGSGPFQITESNKYEQSQLPSHQ
jgi:hypothetical protein